MICINSRHNPSKAWNSGRQRQALGGGGPVAGCRARFNRGSLCLNPAASPINPASQITQEIRDNDAYAFTGITTTNKAYTVNGLNQYTAVAGTGHTYDANGNLTSDGTNAYIYDGENRLVSATTAGQTATLTYDPLGRLWQLVKGTANTRFLYDGDALVAEYNAAGTLTQRYVHGSNAAADDPLIWYEGGATKRYLHADHLGSIIVATNAAVTPSLNAYDEYGVPKSGNVGRFQYTGQILVSELASAACPGLYHYKARLYSPCLGRFLQVDPVGYKDQSNLYAYVMNDPINASDPTGDIIRLSGGRDDQERLRQAVLAVARSSPALRERFMTLITSYYVHMLRFGDPGGPPGTPANTNPVIPINATNGTGTDTKTTIDPFYREGANSRGEDLQSQIAHELFGHGYHDDRGTTKTGTDPATGVQRSEEQAMAAENNYNKAQGKEPVKSYNDRPLPQWSINGDIISGTRMQGSRICPKDENGSQQNSC